MKEKTILFDLDGTLIDSTSAILESFEKAFKTFQNPNFNQDKICSLIGHTLEDIFINLNIKEDEISAYIKAYKTHYETIYLSQTTLLPFAKEALKLAFKFGDIGVVTTKTSAFSKKLLEHLDVIDMITCVVGREDVKEPKPSAEPILKALNLLGKNKTKAYMIGDTRFDIEAAKNAGISCIAVSCGYESEQSLKMQNEFVEENAFHAVKLIKEL